ncbi:ER membrane glycoprotein subunit of the GPI transamidase complex-like protein [Coemansia sp. RSA 1939]|nr:ER membrane glycoprotein subunit of the GPI transamidase complex-like protein [Coemansia sp. RSA 1939]KAJ2615927.1 ER membrane glycoprotein subunit of the GPI transamidase complex-like protein [Coemansia sp. RSA 1804]KAJ2678557.1 ER membrane glycoprotein subunit of the GPI transamidase complex-like protein [Coemansia sp. RSA 1285]
MPAPPTGSTRGRCWDVARYAGMSRLAALLLGYVSNAIVSDYDSSASLSLPAQSSAAQGIVRRLAHVVVRWDAFYFKHIAEAGYVYEQEHAFFPLLPLVMRVFARTALAPLDGWLGPQLVLVLAGVLVSNVCFVLASVTLYKLGCGTLRSERLAYAAALLFVLAPSNMFMSAVYTESLFAYLVFSALLLVTRRRYAWAAVVLCASTLCRANGVVYAGFFWWDLVVQPCILRQRSSQKPAALRWFVGLAVQAARATALTAVAALGFVAFQALGRQMLCDHQQAVPQNHDMRPYCSGVATVYGFVQAHYWDVGFMRYYTPNQIPNFALAVPMVVLALCGIWAYVVSDPVRAATLGMCSHKAEGANGALLGSAYLGDSLLPHMYLWALLLFVAVTTMHVQVITRFFSSVPAVFWYAAHAVCGSASASAGAGASGGDPGRSWRRRAVVWYFVGYGMAGVVLFSNFFPPA